MTQLLLIEGDDATIAKLREKLDAVEGLRAVGLFQAMKSRCVCPDDLSGRHPGKLSSMGPRFRWWVHRGCGKPSGGIHWIGNMLNRGEIKPSPRPNEPQIVIDSLHAHDYGFHKEEM